MTKRFSAKQRLLLGTILGAAGTLLMPTAAWADCNGAGTSVICSGTDPDGDQTSTTGVTIDVQPGAAVGAGSATPSPLLSAGSTSVLNNYGAVNSAATAVSLGGGSTVNNFTTSDTLFGVITGDVAFGATTGSEVNTLNNLDWASVVTGNINSSGALFIFNNDFAVINGNIASAGPLNINNTDSFINGNIIGSSGADTIATNGVGSITGNLALGAGNDTVTNNYWIGGTVDLGSGDNSLTNGFSVAGNIIAGSGNDTVTNNSTAVITGNIDLGDGNNIISNAGAIIGNVATGAGDDTLANDPATGVLRGNVDLGSGTDTISNLVGSGTVTKSGTGTLTLTGNNSGFSAAFGTTTVLNLNGGAVSIASANNMFNGALTFDGGTLQTTGALTLPDDITLNAGGGTFDTGADLTLSQAITGTGGMTKTGNGNLTLGGPNTYSGGTSISAGTLTGTTSSLQGNIVDNAALVFDQNFGGTYAGNISGFGTLTRITSNTVTLTGNNTYSGATFVNSGVLAVGGTGIGDASAVTVDLLGTLQLNADEAIGSLAGTGPLWGDFTLTTGANNGTTAFSGTVNGLTGIDKVGTGTFSLTGTGTLTNGFSVNGGTLAIGGTYTSPTNSVASSATLNVLISGALAGDVTAASGATTIVNGAVTGNVANAGALSGTGTVLGAVTNSGTLNPGNNSIGIFNVDGSYSETAAGTLAIELTPATVPVAGTNYDQLLVTGSAGTATLDGTLVVAPAGGLYVAGATYDVVNATGGISGNFATISGNVLSPFIALTPTGVVTLSGTDQVFRLTVTRTPFATGIGSGATPNQIAVANGFQGLVSGAAGETAVLVSSVDMLNVAQAQQLFDQASPEPYGAYARSLLDQGELFSRQVDLQTHETPNVLPGLDIWGRGYGLWGRGRNQAFRFGSDIYTWGLAAGATYRGSDFYIGAAGGFSKDKVRYKLGNSDGHNDGWQAGVFGGYQAGPVSIDAQIDYIHARVDATRSIGVASIVSEANGRTQGHQWKFIGTAGYNFDLASMKVRPFVGFDYTTGKLNPFTETGAGAANLTVEKIRANRSDLMVGLDLEANPHAQISPYGRIVYRHNLDSQRDDITALFNGDIATEFTVNAVTPKKDQLDVDAGVNLQASPNLAIFAGYQGTFRGDLNSHGFSAGLSYSFGVAPPPPPRPSAALPLPIPSGPATQTCANASVMLATDTCPALPSPPQPQATKGERGQ
jgi:fibronectin-binding autotransporter adhesin